jgi:hypothetical protein
VAAGILKFISLLLIPSSVLLLVRRSWWTMPRWQRLWVFIGAQIIAVADVLLTLRPDLLRRPPLAVDAGTAVVTIALFWGIAVFESRRRDSALLREPRRDESRNTMSSDRNERKSRMKRPTPTIPRRKRKIYRIVEWGQTHKPCAKCGGRVTLRKRNQRASGGSRPTTIAPYLFKCTDCGDTFKSHGVKI